MASLLDKLLGREAQPPSNLPTVTDLMGIARSNPSYPKTVITAPFQQTGFTQKSSLSADDLNRLMETVNTPSTKEGQAMLAQMKDTIGKYMAVPETGQTNIAPFLAAADFWNGTNMLKGYKTPEQLKQEKLALGLGAMGDYVKGAKEIGGLEKDLAIAELMTNLGTATEQTGTKPVTVSGGGSAAGKLPTKATGELASIQSGIKNLDLLYNSWKNNVGGIGSGLHAVTDYLGNKAAGMVPNTKTSIYLKLRDQMADEIAAALNAGRATDADRENVKRVLPAEGDSEETARSKIVSFKEKMITKFNEIKTQHQNAGYNAEGISTLQQAPDTGVTQPANPAPLTQAESLRLQQLRAKKAGVK